MTTLSGGLRCLCITSGVAGFFNQVRGLASALTSNWDHRQIALRDPWRQVPPFLIPVNNRVLANPSDLANGSADLIISCGRQSVLPALVFKKRYGQEVFVVHIQDPKVDPRRFDLVVAPEHDGLHADNVLHSVGAIHHVTEELLADARSAAPATWRDPDRDLVGLILGGPNRYFAFDAADVRRLVESVRQMLEAHDVLLAVVPSRRTPRWAVDRLMNAFGDNHYVWDGKGPNLYLPLLGTASYLIVTADSISMISEAAATGRPVFVAAPRTKRPARRFERFHRSFEAAGVTRPFEGKLELWEYAPLTEARRIARIVLHQMEISKNVAT